MVYTDAAEYNCRTSFVALATREAGERVVLQHPTEGYNSG